MSFRLKNQQAVSTYLKRYALRIEGQLLYGLEALVAELETHAKLSAGYDDQTSNLKGSIGGVVLKNGRPISYRGFDTDGDEGNTTGLEFINSLIGDYSKGYVILVVAGMEYATYVEDFHNKNVLKKTELKMKQDLPKLLAKIKRKIR